MNTFYVCVCVCVCGCVCAMVKQDTAIVLKTCTLNFSEDLSFSMLSKYQTILCSTY